MLTAAFATAMLLGPAVGAPALDPAPAGIDVTVPRGWRLLEPPVTGLSYPVDRLLLTSYPTRGGGNCAPNRAQRDLPPDGALVYLQEFRPPVGPVWRHLRRAFFPPRPTHFTLRARDLGRYECWRSPTYAIRFRAADRPFTAYVALGSRAGAARRAQALAALDSLRFDRLPPPPPDPYAGWNRLHDELGDTLRTPPSWLAVAVPSPRRRAQPRTLFFTANRPLPGLPRRRTTTQLALPRRIPLAAFPDDAVLLWIREAKPGSATFRWPRLPAARAWPQSGDFTSEATGPLRRSRAAVTSRRTRFSLWLVSGPRASAADRELALRAAASFAFSSGSFRNRACRRVCQSGAPLNVIAPGDTLVAAAT